MKMFIHGGTIVDPGGFCGTGHILVQDGTIAAIGPNIPRPHDGDDALTVVDATGLTVVPGFVDLHAHLREPGFEYKETIASGTHSAVAGGFTTVCCMPNTKPVNDNQAVTEFILSKAHKANRAHVFPIGAITKGSEGEELSEIGELAEAGCVAISDDGRPVMNNQVMRRAMEYAKTFDLPVIDHCECLHLSDRGCMNEGFVSTELGMPGIPNASEDVMVARNIALAELTGARLHLAHLSTAGSVKLTRQAKAQGLPVTAEVCPHHFSLTDAATRSFHANAKMNPPLRTQADVDAVKEGLADGTIDAIATDHAPHAVQEKQLEFDRAPFGIVGFETAFSLTMALVDERVLTFAQSISKLTTEPARVFGLQKGTLAVGADADLVILHPEQPWTVDPEQFYSKSRNTPFGGWNLKGRILKTLVSGRVVFDAT